MAHFSAFLLSLLYTGCREAVLFEMTDATRERIDELTATLAHIQCFQGLRPDILVAIAGHIHYHHYQADQVVIIENEPCVGLGIIKTGRLKAVRLAASGREQTLSVLGPGEIFNAAGVFADAPNPVTIIALEPSGLWMIPKGSLIALQDRYPELTRNIACNLAQRVLTLVDLVEDLSLRTVEMRLAHQLLINAQDNIVPRESWATQAEMSARLGTVTYVLNRTLRGLEEAGLIEVDREEIRILDPVGLAAKAEPR